MAWHGGQKQHPVRLIRGRVQVVTSFKGITPENIMDITHSDQELGNSKFIDQRLIYCYFKKHFRLARAAEMVGYSVSVRPNGTLSGAVSMSPRIQAMNPESIIDVAREMVKHHLITMDDLRKILMIKGNTRNQRIAQSGKVYKSIAKRLVTESIAKFGTRKKSANVFGITLEDINYWADLEV